MGISRGQTATPKCSRKESKTRLKRASLSSNRLMKNARGIPAREAAFHCNSVPTCTPARPSTTINILSATRIASDTSALKSMYPGVSNMLIFLSNQVMGSTEVEIEIPRLISSSSKSLTVFPSAILPKRSVALDKYSIASAREVFPLPLCPVKQILRILLGFIVSMALSPLMESSILRKNALSSLYRKKPNISIRFHPY